jgi:hypothetical protein
MTARPLNFTLNTDYATLKNDSNTQTITLSLPATTLTTTTPVYFSAAYTAGVSGAPMDFDINYSMTSQRFIANFLQIEENFTTTNWYDVVIKLFRSGATTVKVKVSMFYGGPSASITSNARTVTVRIRTFTPPFS